MIKRVRSSLAGLGARTAVAAVGALVSVAVMAAQSWAATTPCTGPLGAVEINGNVSAGAGCDLSGTTVKGNVTVTPGGSLSSKAGSRTVITGNLESTNATHITLEGTTEVGGRLLLTGTAGRIDLSGSANGNLIIEGGIPFLTVEHEAVGGNLKVLNSSGAEFGEVGIVGISASAVGGNLEISGNSLSGIIQNGIGLESTSIGGNLLISNNSATGAGGFNILSVGHNAVGGNASLVNNTAGNFYTEVFANSVGGNLNCEGNKPPPAGEGNSAKKKLGQCALL
jgi:hypothetical protein